MDPTIEPALAGPLATSVAIAILATIYLLASHLDRLAARQRDAILAACAGTSLAYVMLSLLPKLADEQPRLLAPGSDTVSIFAEHRTYLVALAGMMVYYLGSFVNTGVSGAPNAASTTVQRFKTALAPAIHCAYSALIAYLVVHRLDVDRLSLALITIGVATLFLINASGLREPDPQTYDRSTRWLLAFFVLLGGMLGAVIALSPVTIALWFAFLAGIMLFITLAEKLTFDRGTAFAPFFAGVLAMGILIVVLDQ